MGDSEMRRISYDVPLVTLSTLVLEVMLTRAFDVTLAPNISYFVVTLAVLSFGVAGTYAILRPILIGPSIRGILRTHSLTFALTNLLLISVINVLPFDCAHLGDHPAKIGSAFAALYPVLSLP